MISASISPIDRSLARFTFVVVLLLASTWMHAAPASAGDPPGSGRLGKFGDIRTLPIEGAAAIPADLLRRTLARDWALQVVLAPSAPVEDFNAIIADRARGAYLASGFPSPKVSLRFDDAGNPQALIVDEGGPRRRRGRVRIDGARAIPVDAVIAELTGASAQVTRTPFAFELNPELSAARINSFDSRAPSNVKPTWEVGKWASFHPATKQRVQRKTAAALAGCGFFRAKFTLDVIPIAGSNTEAELVITITDEGPAARLGGVEITGLRRNPRDAVIAAAGLKPQQPIDLRALLVAQQSLWDTGRFIKHAMLLEPDPDAAAAAAGVMRLKLDVREHDKLPLLSEPLSPVQQAVLRFGSWMESFDRGDSELLATTEVAGLRGDVILTARGAWMGHFRDAGSATPTTAATARNTTTATAGVAGAAAAAATTRATRFDYAVAASTDTAAIFDLAGGRRVDASALPVLRPDVAIWMGPNFENGERWKSFNIGAGVKSSERRSKFDPPLTPPSLGCVLAPVVLLDLLDPTDVPPVERPTVTLSDGVLDVRGKPWRMKIDAASGRLLGMAMPTLGAGEETITVSTRPAGELATRIDALLRGTPQVIRVENPADLEAAIRVCTALAGAIPMPQEWRDTIRPIARLEPAAAPLAVLLRPLAVSLKQELEALTRARGAGGDDEEIDFDMAPPMPGTPTDLTAIYGIAGAIGADAAAPRGHWAWTLIRESLLLRGGEFRSAGREITRLHREKRVGPVAAMAFARSPLGGPKPAAAFAQAALAMPEPQALVDDLRFTVEGETALARGVRGSAEVLRTMNDADVQAIARVLTPTIAPRFERIARLLKERRDEPVEKVILDAIAQLWTPAVRDQLIADLSTIAAGKRP